MKHLVLLVTLLQILACKSNNTNETDKLLSETDQLLDSLDRAKKVASMVQSTIRSALLDTAGIANAPIKVLSAKVVKSEYGSREVKVSWKNVSDKKIEAIKFKWYGVDAFNKPASMGQGFDGLGAGLADNALSPGKTSSGTWTIYSSTAKKILCAWPYEVAFADGTIWKQSN